MRHQAFDIWQRYLHKLYRLLAVCEEYVRSNRSELFVRTKYPENNELSDVKNMDLGSSAGLGLGWIMGRGVEGQWKLKL